MNINDNPTDGVLISLYKKGDKTVLPVLVGRYHKVFCQKAYWITKDKETAKDIAQESWVIIINKIHTLKNVDNFKSWAYRIVYTKAIDVVKLRSKERANLNSLLDSESEIQAFPKDKEQLYKALSLAIKKLSSDKQDIIRLFYAEGYNINQISVFLNIPTGTVKSRLFKAREKLKSILKNRS